METPKPELWVVDSFSSEQWNEKPRIFKVFFGTGLIGFIASLILAVLIPGMRSVEASLLFASTCATIATPILIAAQLAAEDGFLHRFTSSVNRTILELTGNRSDALSVDQLKALINTDDVLPLLVNGVPGLALRATLRKTTAGQDWKSPGTPERMGQAPLPTSPRSDKRLRIVELGARLSLLISNAAPRHILSHEQQQTRPGSQQATERTYVVITATPPDYGTASFDMLLNAGNDANPAPNSTAR